MDVIFSMSHWNLEWQPQVDFLIICGWQKLTIYLWRWMLYDISGFLLETKSPNCISTQNMYSDGVSNEHPFSWKN